MKNLKQTRQTLLSLDSPIYIAGHIKPDQDSIGSCLALARYLNNLGKTAYVLLEDKDKEILKWQNDYSLIVNDVNEENYSFIALDLNEKKRLGRFESYFDRASYTINIDHHQDNKKEANFTVSLPGMSSTCEMLFYIIGKNNLTIPISESLYSGILTDTNCFTRRLSPNTLNVAQKLINTGINYEPIIKRTLQYRTMYQFKALSKLINELQYNEYFH